MIKYMKIVSDDNMIAQFKRWYRNGRRQFKKMTGEAVNKYPGIKVTAEPNTIGVYCDLVYIDGGVSTKDCVLDGKPDTDVDTIVDRIVNVGKLFKTPKKGKSILSGILTVNPDSILSMDGGTVYEDIVDLVYRVTELPELQLLFKCNHFTDVDGASHLMCNNGEYGTVNEVYYDMGKGVDVIEYTEKSSSKSDDRMNTESLRFGMLDLRNGFLDEDSIEYPTDGGVTYKLLDDGLPPDKTRVMSYLTMGLDKRVVVSNDKRTDTKAYSGTIEEANWTHIGPGGLLVPYIRVKIIKVVQSYPDEVSINIGSSFRYNEMCIGDLVRLDSTGAEVSFIHRNTNVGDMIKSPGKCPYCGSMLTQDPYCSDPDNCIGVKIRQVINILNILDINYDAIKLANKLKVKSPVEVLACTPNLERKLHNLPSKEDLLRLILPELTSDDIILDMVVMLETDTKVNIDSLIKYAYDSELDSSELVSRFFDNKNNRKLTKFLLEI